MKPITQGQDFNFFKEVVRIDGYSTYPVDSDVTINIRFINSFSLINEAASGKVYYSFNGTTDHGSLSVGLPSQAIIFDNRRISSIWFRSPTGPVYCRVEAWCNS